MKLNGIVTVYNNGGENENFKTQLIPKLLNGVYVEVTKGSNSGAEGDRNGDRLFVLIPFNPLLKGFLKPLEYAKSDNKTDCWTLSDGDYIAVGDVGAADSFAELAEKAEVFRITEVKTFDFGGLPHWEVTAV